MITSTKKLHLHHIFCLCAVVAITVIGFNDTVKAQLQDGPPREFTDPDQLLTLDKNNTFPEAISVINQFAQDYENKFIIDRSNFTGSIGLDLPSMYWKDALDFILNFNGLELVNNETYYQIQIPEVMDGLTSASAGGTGPNVQALASLKTREIRINATFFEGNKRALQEIGVDWSTLTSDVPARIGDFVTEQGQEQLPTDLFTNDQFVNVNSFGAQNVSQNVFNAVFNSGEIGNSQISVQALFSAFEADNLGEILATPFTTVIDGEEGKIQVGQDFSIKQRDFAGNVTDVFFSTGTILTVTPNVIVEDSIEFIYLDVAAERSSAAPDPVSTIINKTEATTKALLVDGETTVLAGLYRTEQQSIRRGIPLLKDIPVLGYLFGYNSKDVIENELVILITAEIVNTIPERVISMEQSKKSKRQILDDARQRNKNDLDYIPPTVLEILPPLAEMDSDSVTEDNSIAMDESPEVQSEDSVQVDVTDAGEGTTNPEDFTPEQEQLAEELSLPVDDPELMVVIPKAFDLEKFLEYKENGVEIPEEVSEEKFYVIGGSFIVRKNAYTFQDRLRELGYQTRMLFNTRSRFHFVAYDGYNTFEEAVSELKNLREVANQDAWLFIYSNGETELQNNQ